MTRRHSLLFSRYAWLWLGASTAALGVTDYVLRAPYGLNATYHPSPDWTPGTGTATYIDSLPSTAVLKRRRPDFADRPFSVEWRGFLLVPADGTYVFSLISDDGSSLTIDGRVVVDNPGLHGPAEQRGTVVLSAGAHSLVVRYFQGGGDLALALRWGPDHGSLAAVATGSLTTSRVSRARVAARRTVDTLWWLFAFAWPLCAAFALAPRIVERLGRSGLADPALGAVLGLSVLLNAWGIWWALPNTRGWAPDELVPADVLDGASVWFSGGWHSKYPILHYAVLTLAYAPLWAWCRMTELEMREPTVYAALFFIGRSVSVLSAAGVIVMVFQCGRQLYGRTGAAFSALTAALMAPFVYYGKTANLEAPYLFWFAVSLWAYVRILKRHARTDYMWFALSAALAVCTKDQAYGLFALAPFAIVASRIKQRLPVFDRTTSLALGVAAVTFLLAGNLLFNLGGFMAHLRVITGPASAGYQMFAGTVDGQLEMAVTFLRELRHVFGWPLAVVVLIGLFWGLVQARTSPALLWLLVPVLGYYVTFLAVVLYFYDRFLLPIGLVLAIFAGGWMERFLDTPGPAGRIRQVLVGAVFLYSIAYVVSVDLTMTNDSRIRVSHWVRARLGPGDTVAARGPLEYFLLAEGLPNVSVDSIEHVQAVRPTFVILNPWHLEQMPPGHPSRAMRAYLLEERSGYRLALRYKTPPARLPGRHPDLGPTPRTPEWSSLAQLNPALEVFARDPGDK